MRLNEIVRSDRAPLYHWMSTAKAESAFSTDTLEARRVHLLDGRRVRGNSFTRNSRYVQHDPVRIEVDRNILGQSNRIVPVAADLTWIRTMQASGQLPADYDTSGIDRSAYRWSRDYSGKHLADEEFVIGDIRRLHRTIIAIRLNTTDDEMTEIARVYADRYGIELAKG